MQSGDATLITECVEGLVSNYLFILVFFLKYCPSEETDKKAIDTSEKSQNQVY